MCGLFGWFTSLLQKLFKMAMSMGSFATRVVATIVVALDGSGDTTDIQTGIDLLPATGGSVYIREGTYTITARINLNKPNVSIIGAGRSTIIQTIDDITLIRIAAADLADGCIVDKIYLKGSDLINQVGIFIETDDCFVTDCWIDDMNIGIQIENGDDCIILNNRVSSCEDAGIGALGAVGQTRLIINTNAVDNCESGIRLNNVTDSIVVGNISRNNDYYGIEIGDDCSEIVINGNTCIDNDDNGIALFDDVNNCTFTGNISANNGSYGVRVWDATCNKNIISSNVLTGNTSGGLRNNGTNTQIGHNVT